jgi:hypothetical protein
VQLTAAFEREAVARGGQGLGRLAPLEAGAGGVQAKHLAPRDWPDDNRKANGDALELGIPVKPGKMIGLPPESMIGFDRNR